jgi:hypothetical protein
VILLEAITTNPVHQMKKHLLVAFVIAAALTIMPQLFAKSSSSHSRSAQSLFAEEEEENDDAAPSDEVVRKLGAMMPTQTFERKESTKSDGKVAPKDTTIYPIDIKNAEGKVELKLFFFKGDSGKWSVFDEAGNVMHET